MNKKARLVNIDAEFNKAVGEAVKCFNAGEVFIYPTDTVYGFGCDPFNEKAIKKINTIKQREQPKQFILLVDSISTLSDYTIISEKYKEELLSKIWSIPISIIFKLNEDKRKLLGSETAAFRIPDHKFCRRLLEEIKLPLVSTSVNRKNEPSINDTRIIIDNFAGEVDAIFFTNNEEKNEPSTLIDLTGKKPVLLRQGSTKIVDLFKKLL